MDSNLRRPIGRRTLAEELADTLTEDIVADQYRPGDSLPTEPELAEEFSVSRSVVRDATRILSARGLVDVRHGRGAFVTESQMGAFSDALLLALRRVNATAWDVEEFFSLFWPSACALAAQRGSDGQFEQIRRHLNEYLEQYAAFAREEAQNYPGGNRSTADPDQQEERLEELQLRSRAFLNAILAATGNKLFLLLAPAIEAIRAPRYWADEEKSWEEAVTLERKGLEPVVDAIEGRDAAAARQAATRWHNFPKEAIDAMRETPVGKAANLPVSMTTLFDEQS